MTEAEWIQEAFRHEVQSIGLENRRCTLIDAGVVTTKGPRVLTLTYSYESDSNMDKKYGLKASSVVRYAVFVEGRDYSMISSILETRRD